MTSIQQEYDGLAKKYSLPSYEEMEKEFEISTIESPFLLRGIVQKIYDRVDHYTHLIDSLLQPDTSNLHSIHESKQFDENEKNDLFELYKKLMRFSRQTLEVALVREPQRDAEFIASFVEHWPQMRKPLLEISKKLQDAWENHRVIKEDLEYFG